ncbi:MULTISPECIES: non-hemolytic enterotoxin B [Gordonia]|uniref:non-hemolytic enterotoxin B n=1 Tax=Gordonia TaxID=2053 RepID=UPI0008163120|nr:MULTISPECIES: non-hemolytic enterotoxin B [unclassified Gordonia (in: high G+C Gram-positive bacteria)]WGJ88109.1 non-hemolytic enterotoxin B [Gordonia sp. SMJS1]WJG15974.1 non-hemolytic enterotoxin B [Gordonia sp. Swx-4]SCC60784.1 hypothetical protein GA0061091_1443 [Gordonia sp. v-85]
MAITIITRRIVAVGLTAATLAAGGATLVDVPASAADTRNRTYGAYIVGPFPHQKACLDTRNGRNALTNLTDCWPGKGGWYYGGDGA